MKINDKVRLLVRPTGTTSRHYPLTEGNEYVVLDFHGSNVVTTTDEPGVTASYNRDRVIPAHMRQDSPREQQVAVLSGLEGMLMNFKAGIGPTPEFIKYAEDRLADLKFLTTFQSREW